MNNDATILQLASLPAYHRAPFDRIHVCQAVANGLVILAPDPLIQQYPVRVAW